MKGLNPAQKMTFAFGLLLLIVLAELFYLFGATFQIKRFLNPPKFTDVFDKSGLIRQSSTAGVSWTDFDGDGNLDLFIGGNPYHLYRNMGDGTFADVTATSGLVAPENSAITMGVFGDFNNDGCQDVFTIVSPRGSDVLYRGNCNGVFTKVSEFPQTGIPEGGVVLSYAAWADYDGDGFLDLYVARHGYFINVEGDSRPDYGFLPNSLYHNNGDGTFSDVTKKAGVDGITNCGLPPLGVSVIYRKILAGPVKRSFQPIWFDYDGDGKMDLFVPTDDAISPLYKNNGDGTFSEVTKQAGLCRYGSNMGVTVGDFNGDGRLDIYTTNGGPNFLWKNNGDGTFSDVAAEAMATDSKSVGWGTGFFDFDNDGNLDIYVANGGSRLEVVGNYGMLDKKQIDSLFKNNGSGVFTEVALKSGLFGDYSKEAMALGDFNGDGNVDVFVAASSRLRKDQSRLYQNRGTGNHWITVKLVGTKSNRDGVGAVISIKAGDKTQTKEIISSSSYLSENSLWQTFGLGKSSKVDMITVKWPSGKITYLKNVRVDNKIVIEEK